MGNANATTSSFHNNNNSNNLNNNISNAATATGTPPPPSYNPFSTSTIGRLTKQNNRNSSHIMFNHSILSSCSNNNSISSAAAGIQPVHHRTRSLPLTEETAIQISALPPPLPFGQSNKKLTAHKCYGQCNKNSSLCALHNNGLNNNDRSACSLVNACSSTSVSCVDGAISPSNNNNFHQDSNSSILQSLTAAAAADEARTQATSKSSKDQEYLFMESSSVANGVGHMEPDYVNCNNNAGSFSRAGGKNVSPQLLHRNRNSNSVRCMYNLFFCSIFILIFEFFGARTPRMLVLVLCD
jgi:hypothetical protein